MRDEYEMVEHVNCLHTLSVSSVLVLVNCKNQELAEKLFYFNMRSIPFVVDVQRKHTHTHTYIYFLKVSLKLYSFEQVD